MDEDEFDPTELLALATALNTLTGLHGAFGVALSFLIVSELEQLFGDDLADAVGGARQTRSRRGNYHRDRGYALTTMD
jgi:hypothetical protein